MSSADDLFPDHAILYEDLLMGGQVDAQTNVYEDLLRGEQVEVQATVYEGLLKGQQADVDTYRSSIKCGTNSLNVPALQLLPACSSDVFGTSTRRCRNFSRKRKATRRMKEGKVARRRIRVKRAAPI